MHLQIIRGSTSGAASCRSSRAGTLNLNLPPAITVAGGGDIRPSSARAVAFTDEFEDAEAGGVAKQVRGEVVCVCVLKGTG